MTDAIEIVPIHPERIADAWPIVEPWLEKAMSYGPKLYTTESIRLKCLDKEMILWGGIDVKTVELVGMSITSLQEYPLALVADIHWTGGKPGRGDEYLALMLEVIKQWAIKNGATKMGGGGRRGWIKKFGFREAGVMFEMDLAA